MQPPHTLTAGAMTSSWPARRSVPYSYVPYAAACVRSMMRSGIENESSRSSRQNSKVDNGLWQPAAATRSRAEAFRSRLLGLDHNKVRYAIFKVLKMTSFVVEFHLSYCCMLA